MLNDIRVKLNTWCISRDNSFGKSKLNWTLGLALFCLDTAEITIINYTCKIFHSICTSDFSSNLKRYISVVYKNADFVPSS